MWTTAVSFAPAQTPGRTRGRQWVFRAPSTARGEARGTFHSGLEHGYGGRWIPGGASPRRGRFAQGRSAVGDRRRRREPCATALGVSAASCGLVTRGAGLADGAGPPAPQSVDSSHPARPQLGETTRGRIREGRAGGRHARGARGAGCREERGWGGGAGACALHPCHIGMSRSAERRRRLRRSAGGGGRGELPAAPLRRAQQEGGRERASAGVVSGKSTRAGEREEGKKERKRAREG